MKRKRQREREGQKQKQNGWMKSPSEKKNLSNIAHVIVYTGLERQGVNVVLNVDAQRRERRGVCDDEGVYWQAERE